ncbi:MAG TPA: MqnA/MqnD/SBP family protein [Phycisphaerales bacterium]|nr:MqnA/MqnD/SBP family protein [Phycisphaerales bacterium]
MPSLTLAHSADPDDCFMWWPITGKINPDGTPYAGREGRPRIATGDFSFQAVPGDISVFNKLAARADADGGAPYDITALSVRAYADVHDRYIITACGSSFGDGYGPKIVARADNDEIGCENCLKDDTVTIAVPGLRTSAFMTLGLLLGTAGIGTMSRFIEMPFDAIIPAVRDRKVSAGLVIHEGQVTFAQAGLRQVIDLGTWWKKHRGLPLPLGINAVKRDLDARFGGGTVDEVSRLLQMSLDYAMAHRDESIAYTMPFAAINAQHSGTDAPTVELVEKYVDMYVTDLTVDMGQTGRTAIEWLLREGAEAGLCPRVAEIDVVS